MRTKTIDIVHGRVDSTGVAFEGPCTVQKVAAGRYWIYAPPGRRLMSIAVIGFQFPQWAFVQTADFTGRGVLLLFANTGGTAEVDESFAYTAFLAA